MLFYWSKKTTEKAKEVVGPIVLMQKLKLSHAKVRKHYFLKKTITVPVLSEERDLCTSGPFVERYLSPVLRIERLTATSPDGSTGLNQYFVTEKAIYWAIKSWQVPIQVVVTGCNLSDGFGQDLANFA